MFLILMIIYDVRTYEILLYIYVEDLIFGYIGLELMDEKLFQKIQILDEKSKRHVYLLRFIKDLQKGSKR